MQIVFQDLTDRSIRATGARLVAEPFHLVEDAPVGAARERAVAEALEAVGMAARTPASTFMNFPAASVSGLRSRGHSSSGHG